MDYFWYALPQEDFDNKWQAIGWPYKIQKQIDATNEFLMEETARYYTLQLNDENALNDRIEMFTVQVTNLSAARDPAKVMLSILQLPKLISLTSRHMKSLWKSEDFGNR